MYDNNPSKIRLLNLDVRKPVEITFREIKKDYLKAIIGTIQKETGRRYTSFCNKKNKSLLIVRLT